MILCGRRMVFSHSSRSQLTKLGRNHVTDYRFEETGLTPMWLATAPPFADVRYRIAGLIQDKTLVGYALEQFLSVRCS
jgi:hypothetical protein